jgi:hypothetical protein
MVTRQSLAGLISRMERDGHISVATASRDRRSRMVTMTASGRRVWQIQASRKSARTTNRYSRIFPSTTLRIRSLPAQDTGKHAEIDDSEPPPRIESARLTSTSPAARDGLSGVLDAEFPARRAADGADGAGGANSASHAADAVSLRGAGARHCPADTVVWLDFEGIYAPSARSANGQQRQLRVPRGGAATAIAARARVR